MFLMGLEAYQIPFSARTSLALRIMPIRPKASGVQGLPNSILCGWYTLRAGPRVVPNALYVRLLQTYINSICVRLFQLTPPV